MKRVTKRPPGRPPVDRPTGRRITVYLLPDVEAKAMEIGGGVLSQGITKAVRVYRRRTDADAEFCPPRCDVCGAFHVNVPPCEGATSVTSEPR